eukprot:scaffold57059_cov55-Phaeocystis_antarctica.AAC.3
MAAQAPPRAWSGPAALQGPLSTPPHLPLPLARPAHSHVAQSRSVGRSLGTQRVDPRRHDRDADLARQRVVVGRAEDDVGVRVHLLLHSPRRLVDLEERQVRAARDVDQHA